MSIPFFSAWNDTRYTALNMRMVLLCFVLLWSYYQLIVIGVIYRQICNIKRTKTQNYNVFRLVL